MEDRPLEQHAKRHSDYSGEISYNKTVKRIVGANGDEVILDIFKNVKRPVLNFLIELYCITTVTQDRRHGNPAC
jgi:hypothetical protein